ncbi:MAG: hypothetical protein JWO38_5021 [Gemmataceae bacterium]|nr:hypothetical protein [Gemmataceae bacterium]
MALVLADHRPDLGQVPDLMPERGRVRAGERGAAGAAGGRDTRDDLRALVGGKPGAGVLRTTGLSAPGLARPGPVRGRLGVRVLGTGRDGRVLWGHPGRRPGELLAEVPDLGPELIDPGEQGRDERPHRGCHLVTEFRREAAGGGSRHAPSDTKSSRPYQANRAGCERLPTYLSLTPTRLGLEVMKRRVEACLVRWYDRLRAADWWQEAA